MGETTPKRSAASTKPESFRNRFIMPVIFEQKQDLKRTGSPATADSAEPVGRVDFVAAAAEPRFSRQHIALE